MAKFLITGITGFAGAHLANLLHENGHEVYGLIRRTNGMESDIRDVVSDDAYEAITFVYADLTNYRSLRSIFEKTQFDGVFHLAAQSHPPTSFIDPIGTMQTNVMGSANLIQVIQDHQEDCKLMFCSTLKYMVTSVKTDVRFIGKTVSFLLTLTVLLRQQPMSICRNV